MSSWLNPKLFLKASGLALIVLALTAAPAWSQSSNGSVRGIVQDPTSAVIPNVTVVLTNTATGVELKTVSNGAGLYVFPSVIPGPYKITADSAGMNKFEATLQVQTQGSATVDITFQPAGTQDHGDVQDVTPVVTTDTASLGYTLERARIEQLPINGRNVMNLMNTVPGVTFDTDGNLRTFGGRVGTHDVVLDGAALTDEVYGGGTVSRPPGLDSIQEFHVEVNSSSAKYARPTNVILTTKSGTNQIHGSLFETNRDYGYGVARARDNFTNTAAKLIRNEFGGTVGGPVYIPKLYNGKNRSFWFFSYEGFKQRTGSFGNYRVPTACHAQRRFLGPGELGGNPVSHLRPADHAVRRQQVCPLALHLQRQDQQHRPGADQPADEIHLQHPAGAEHPRRESADRQQLQRAQSQHPEPVHLFHAVRPALHGPGPGVRPHHQGRREHVPPGCGRRAHARRIRQFPLRHVPEREPVPGLDPHLLADLGQRVHCSAPAERFPPVSPAIPTVNYAAQLGLPNPNGVPGYPVINNIGVGTGSSNYFQPTNWNLRYFNYFILEDNVTKVKGKHEIQFGIHLRQDRNNWMPQQQRTAGAETFVATPPPCTTPRRAPPPIGWLR